MHEHPVIHARHVPRWALRNELIQHTHVELHGRDGGHVRVSAAEQVPSPRTRAARRECFAGAFWTAVGLPRGAMRVYWLDDLPDVGGRCVTLARLPAGFPARKSPRATAGRIREYSLERGIDMKRLVGMFVVGGGDLAPV